MGRDGAARHAQDLHRLALLLAEAHGGHGLLGHLVRHDDGPRVVVVLFAVVDGPAHGFARGGEPIQSSSSSSSCCCPHTESFRGRVSMAGAGRHVQALLDVHLLDHGVILAFQRRRQRLDAFVRRVGGIGGGARSMRRILELGTVLVPTTAAFAAAFAAAAAAVVQLARPRVAGGAAARVAREPVGLELGDQGFERR